jgi:ABC-type microcin C transport system permease subunit YejB
MLQYFFKRLLISVPLLLGITLLSFVVIYLAPGEPIVLQQELQAALPATREEAAPLGHHVVVAVEQLEAIDGALVIRGSSKLVPGAS